MPTKLPKDINHGKFEEQLKSLMASQKKSPVPRSQFIKKIEEKFGEVFGPEPKPNIKPSIFRGSLVSEFLVVRTMRNGTARNLKTKTSLENYILDNLANKSSIELIVGFANEKEFLRFERAFNELKPRLLSDLPESNFFFDFHAVNVVAIRFKPGTSEIKSVLVKSSGGENGQHGFLEVPWDYVQKRAISATVLKFKVP